MKDAKGALVKAELAASTAAAVLAAAAGRKAAAAVAKTDFKEVISINTQPDGDVKEEVISIDTQPGGNPDSVSLDTEAVQCNKEDHIRHQYQMAKVGPAQTKRHADNYIATNKLRSLQSICAIFL